SARPLRGAARGQHPAHARAAGGREPVTSRVALVTGAASGIGRACVRRLVAAGTAVAAIDLDADAMSDLDVLALAADVTDDAAVRAAVARVEAELGPLDGVVNVAGIPGSADAADCAA